MNRLIYKRLWVVGVFVFAAIAVQFIPSNKVLAHGSEAYAVFKDNGELVRPVGYREWIYIGAPLTPNDMNNGKAAFPEFHNVYIDPVSWKHWKKTGTFRDGTIIVKELVSVGSKSSFSGKGYFMGEYIGLEAVVKSKSRFSSTSNHWGFFRFTTDNHKVLRGSNKMMAIESCAACHLQNAQQDLIFTQHYPVLRAAKGKYEQGIGGK